MPKKSAETMLTDRKSTRLNSSHTVISYAVFCLRSEEHTSELQSHSDLVCRLLLEKKKHTSELQSHSDLVCRLLLEKKKHTSILSIHHTIARYLQVASDRQINLQLHAPTLQRTCA